MDLAILVDLYLTSVGYRWSKLKELGMINLAHTQRIRTLSKIFFKKLHFSLLVQSDLYKTTTLGPLKSGRIGRVVVL